jgi:hypothetical protein
MPDLVIYLIGESSCSIRMADAFVSSICPFLTDQRKAAKALSATTSDAETSMKSALTNG